MNKKNEKAIKIGAGVAAGIAGALAAGYVLYKNTKPQQKQAKVWIAKAQAEAARQMKNLKHMTQADYDRIMGKAMQHYANIQKIGTSELGTALRDAKAEWKHIQSRGKQVVGAAKKSVKKVGSPTAKKAAKKASAKKKAPKRK